MATASISRSIPEPKKRTRGLTIATASLISEWIPLVSGGAYALLIALLLGALYPSMTQANLGAYLSSNVVSGMIGAHLTTITGFTVFLGIYLYSAFYGLLYGGIVAYIGGVALPINIENGMLDLALSRPISRTRYYLENWLAVLIGAIILSLLTIFSAWLTSLFIKNPGIDWQWMWITQLVQLAFLVFAAGVGMLFGSFMNTSRAAGWSAVGIIALGYILNIFGGLSDKYNWLLKISPYYYAPGIDPLVFHKLTWWNPWVLVSVGFVLGIAGLVIFNKRDLPTI